ncbi:MAG TPA: hypothetical protein VI365_16780 [Trebonia sp.]
MKARATEQQAQWWIALAVVVLWVIDHLPSPGVARRAAAAPDVAP